MKKMRLLFLAILLMYLPDLVFSQDYEPMAQDQNRWIVKRTDANTWYILDLWEYHINGDTTVDGTDYFKVYYRDLVVTQDGPPYEAENEYQLFGLLRDDINNRKVYGIQFEDYQYNNCAPDEEVLLYDFSLNVDDTVSSCIFDSYYDVVLQDIHSTTQFGYSTIVYVGGDSYYEGIGSDFGLFELNFIPVKSGDNQLERNSLQHFCRQDSCSLVVSIEEPDVNKSISISPNPADEYVIIEAGVSGSIHSVVIRDMLGNEVLRKIAENHKSKLQINTFRLPRGVYLITVIDKNGISVRSEKIIVK